MQELITKKELEELVNKLDNGIDKFILLGFYYGLNGSASYKEQLLNLEVDSVDFENKKIDLPDGREIIMDKLLEKICKEAVNQKIYIKLGSKGGTNEDYTLNPNSKYIIKVKPTKLTNNGLTPLKISGIKKRMSMISDYLGFNITANMLKVSGVYELLKNQHKKMTIAEAETLLKKNGMSIRKNNLIPILRELNEQV